MKVRKLAAPVGAAAVMIGIAASTVAPASAANTIRVFGQQETLNDYATGAPMIGYTVDGLSPSSDAMPFPVNGRLYEATVTVDALGGWATPLIPLFNARAESGHNYRVLGAGPQSLSGAAVPPGGSSTGNWAPQEWSDSRAGSLSATIEHEIEVEVPVSTAYNQWTQFEEFPRFMEGVESVEQLDDTLLHWAATVAGKKAEWDAKIVEQVPDRRIVWESVDGKQTRGTVSFEPAGSAGRTRVRLEMSYQPEGVGEKVGSAVGLDQRRVRSDLERFRELIEGQQVESGAWRGEINGGETTTQERPA